MPSTFTVLPIVTIQPDFTTVIDEVRTGVVPFDTFWVSCYKTSEPSVHAKVHAELDENDRDLVRLHPKDGDVDVVWGGDMYSVECPPLGIPPTKILLPKQVYADPQRSDPRHPSQITAFDVSPDTSQWATGFHDGSVHIYPSTSQAQELQKYSKVHLSSVTSLRFFPSSKVLLTGGADFTLTILSADPLEVSSVTSPVRMLRAHTRAITSTAIIARGRNILSSAKDGTVRLWDVSGGEQIRSLAAGTGKYIPVNGISVGKRRSEVGKMQPDDEELSIANGAEQDPREVETADKVVWCALNDGSMEAFDLASKKSIHHQKSTFANGPLSAITFFEENSLLATGSSTGVVEVYDVRALGSPMYSFQRNGASIEDLAFMNYGGEHTGLAIATEDGLPFIAGVKPGGMEVVAELIGGDCDGLRSVRVSEHGDVWTAGDDGIVRKYRLLK